MLNLLHGDCLEQMASIESGSVDLILTDPPYGMDFQSNRSKKGPRHKKIMGDEAINNSWIPGAYRLMTTEMSMLPIQETIVSRSSHRMEILFPNGVVLETVPGKQTILNPSLQIQMVVFM